MYAPRSPPTTPTDGITPTSVAAASSSAIKWCKGCKNFRHWPGAFGIEKSRATKCAKCRERQRIKYARTKRKEYFGSEQEEVEREEAKKGVLEEVVEREEAKKGWIRGGVGDTDVEKVHFHGNFVVFGL